MMPAVRTARFALAVVAGALALLGPSPTAQAQEIEPRAYSNIPVGLNFMALGYVHSQGDLSFDTSVPVEDAHLRIDGTFLAYVRSFGFFGRSASVAVAFPYAWLGLLVVRIATDTRRPPRLSSATWWSTAPLPEPQPPLK